MTCALMVKVSSAVMVAVDRRPSRRCARHPQDAARWPRNSRSRFGFQPYWNPRASTVGGRREGPVGDSEGDSSREVIAAPLKSLTLEETVTLLPAVCVALARPR